MKIDSTTVQLILCVAEEGSISRAADRLNLAVAAASKRVSDLEHQLGTPLFKRVPHGVRVTESGERLMAHVRQIDHLIGRLAGDAEVLSRGHDGRIIVGAPKAAIIQFLAADMASLRDTHPQITLKVVEENSKIVQQLLRDRVIDVGIYEKTSGFLDLAQYPYRDDRLVLVFSRPHFEFPEAPVRIDDLLHLPIVSLGKGSAVLTALQRAFRSRGRSLVNHLSVSGFDTMLALVRHGLGVGLMPPEVLRGFHPEPALGSAEIDGDWHLRRYVLSFVEGQANPQALHKLVSALAPPVA